MDDISKPEPFADRRDLTDKIVWEGGILESLEYGINPGDMPEGDEELRKAWTELHEAWQAMQPLLERVEALLPDADGA